MTDREKFEAWFAPKKAEMMRNKIPMLAIIREHQRDLATWQAALASQQPADDGWIEWAGNIEVDEQPVHGMVEVTYRNGVISKCNAGLRFWGHQDIDADIIAYRVVKP